VPLCPKFRSNGVALVQLVPAPILSRQKITTESQNGRGWKGPLWVMSWTWALAFQVLISGCTLPVGMTTSTGGTTAPVPSAVLPLRARFGTFLEAVYTGHIYSPSLQLR